MTDDEEKMWKAMWMEATVISVAEASSTIMVFATMMRDATRKMIESDPPPPGVVQTSVEIISGLAIALRRGEHDPQWVGEQICKALLPIRGVLRDLALANTIRDSADDIEPQMGTPMKVPVHAK